MKAAHRSVALKAQTVPESVCSQGVVYFWNLEHKDGVDELAVTILSINAVTAVSLMTHAFRHVPLSLGEQFLTSIARILSIKQCKQNSSWTS
jgi:hypothetical protein